MTQARCNLIKYTSNAISRALSSLLDRNYLPVRTLRIYRIAFDIISVSFSHMLVYLIKNAITRAFTHFRAMKSPRDVKSGAIGNCILRQCRRAALSQILSTGMAKRQIVKHDSWICDETIGRELARARARACNRLFAFCARIAVPICMRT